MGSVYANAYVPLAASWAADGSHGLNSTCPPSVWLSFPCDGTVCFDLEGEEPEQFYLSPVYVQSSAFRISCLALVERPCPGDGDRYFERVGAGVIKIMLCRDGFDYGDMKLFEPCEQTTFLII